MQLPHVSTPLQVVNEVIKNTKFIRAINKGIDLVKEKEKTFKENMKTKTHGVEKNLDDVG